MPSQTLRWGILAAIRSTALAGLVGASMTIALVVVPPPTATAAVDDKLDIRTTATYTIVPERGLVSVVMDVTATNRSPDTRRGNVITNWYFDRLYFGIPAEATKIAATRGGRRAAVTTTAADGYDEVAVTLSPRLFYRQTAKLRITFEIPGGAPRSTSDIRVGQAFATFYAWANGDIGAVRIVLPAGFEHQTTGADMKASPGEGGTTVLSASGITDAAGWYVWVTAERPAGLQRDRVTTESGEAIVVMSWPEDPDWGTHVSGLLRRGLPVMHELVGLAWPVEGDLEVTEVHTPMLEGYAGMYDQVEDVIRITEDLDDLTILHEALHAWFNDELFISRWINEGLADHYATEALDRLGGARETPPMVSPTDDVAFLLQAWPAPDRIVDEEDEAREDFGYAAAWLLMRDLAEEVGAAGMRDVLDAAHEHQIAYVGAGEPETLARTGDWRLLLDLLEERGGATGAEDLLVRWALGPSVESRLTDRRAAREAYAALVKSGDGWSAPYLVRAPMATWDFVDATERIADARAVLDQRDDVDAAAAALDLAVPGGMEAAYESAGTDLSAAVAIAGAQRDALVDLQEATDAVAAPREPLTQLGLAWGVEPEELLGDARADFEADRLVDSREAADGTVALLDDAERIGTERAVAAAGTVLGVLLLGGALVFVVRRRRRRHRAAVVFTGAVVASEVSPSMDLPVASPAPVEASPVEASPAEALPSEALPSADPPGS